MALTALDGPPEEPGQLMRNVAVTAGHHPGPPGLLGLYQGIPLTGRTCRVHASRSFGSRVARSGRVSSGREATDP
jgi:hypothetical protein